MDTFGEQECGRRVPQIMPAYIRQSRPPDQGFEVAVNDVLRLYGRANCGREDEAVIAPRSASPERFLYLPLAVASEGFYGPLRQVYGAPGCVLRAAIKPPAADRAAS